MSEKARKHYLISQTSADRYPPNGPQYLSWVGIGCSLVGRGQRVRLGHGVIAVSAQEWVGMEWGERQGVGALFSLGNILWRFQKGHWRCGCEIHGWGFRGDEWEGARREEGQTGLMWRGEMEGEVREIVRGKKGDCKGKYMIDSKKSRCWELIEIVWHESLPISESLWFLMISPSSKWPDIIASCKHKKQNEMSCCVLSPFSLYKCK